MHAGTTKIMHLKQNAWWDYEDVHLIYNVCWD